MSRANSEQKDAEKPAGLCYGQVYEASTWLRSVSLLSFLDGGAWLPSRKFVDFRQNPRTRKTVGYGGGANDFPLVQKLLNFKRKPRG